ncbi:hypothetical protein B0T17DRAFT_506064 [Bombardia bombarda]|uniref:NAD-dependent epimerase/dehydratase domain-containing protein n=1 Tax=Bombardia bombarda TaxID=252184 RepID=A0AA39X8Y8_9PEZI|nr:hypothetical protein B0T17DRAFT_506064 [Bombardia bombarda]
MTEPLTLSNPTISHDSLILVTGANGLIASHAVDQLLSAGFRVRGTVRNASKCSYLQRLFSSRHGPDKFELVEVPDYSAPNAWDVSLRGVSGVAHVVCAVDVQARDPEKAAAAELPWQISLLEAARREPSIKAFVLTSSSWAAWTPNAARKVTMTESSWNDEAIALAKDASVDQSSKGMAGFMALKTLVERGLWEWVRREKPRYTFNTLLFSTVMGECLDPQNQGIPSTAGMVHWISENKYIEVLDSMQPQWQIDCRDAGRLFVAVLASSPKVDRERIYGFGQRFSWFKIARILKDLYPNHENMGRPKDTGWDQTEVPNQRGAELLRRVGQQQGWTALEESIRANAESWLKLGERSATNDTYSHFAG